MAYKGKCSGDCCQNIKIVGFTQGDLRAAYIAWLNGASEFHGETGTFPVMQDIFLLYPMLRPKGLDSDVNQVFTCKHFDLETKLCTIYEIRPTMCRMYPNNKKCPCDGCTIEPV